MAKLSEYKHRLDIANNPNTDIETIIQLLSDEEEHIRRRASKNRNLPVDILIKLSTDKDQYVRGCIADNPNLPINIWMKLIKDKSKFVKEQALCNKILQDLINEAKSLETSKDRLIELNDLNINSLKTHLASNPNTPVNILSTYFRSTIAIRQRLARNPSISDDTLISLSKDRKEEVREEVILRHRSRIHLLGHMINDRNITVLNQLSSYLTNPEDLINLSKRFMMMEDNHLTHDIKRGLFRNEYTPGYIVVEFLFEKDYAAEKLFGEKSYWVDTIIKLHEAITDSSSELIKYKSNIALKNLLEASATIYPKMSTDVRKSLSSHSKTPITVLIVLIKDEDQDIQNRALNQFKNSLELTKKAIQIMTQKIKESTTEQNKHEWIKTLKTFADLAFEYHPTIKDELAKDIRLEKSDKCIE